MAKILLKPREGVKVRAEDGSRFIDPKGEKLAMTRYYRARVEDGDLVDVEARKAATKAEKAPKAAGPKTEQKEG